MVVRPSRSSARAIKMPPQATFGAHLRAVRICFLLPQKNNIRIQRSQATRVFRAAALKRFWNLGSPQGLATLWGEEDAPQRRGLPAA